jgi:hypothetical protein
MKVLKIHVLWKIFEELLGYFWGLNFHDFHFTYLQHLIKVI